MLLVPRRCEFTAPCLIQFYEQRFKTLRWRFIGGNSMN